MWYLKTNINGETERLIRHLSLTEANYSTAWKTLEERFYNKRVLSNTLIQKLLDHSIITNDSKTIKSLHDNVKETFSALNNIGIETDKWEPLLLCLLTKKLDRQNHLLYEQSVQNTRQIHPLNEFQTFLNKGFSLLKPLDQKREKNKIYMHQLKLKHNITVSFVRNQSRKEKKTPAERLNWVQKQK